jgi:hypothetical protein
VHKQASENYIKYLEDQVNKFRKGDLSSFWRNPNPIYIMKSRL